MNLFHLAAIPLFLLTLSGVYASKNTDFKRLAVLFLKGAGVFIPAFLIYMLCRSVLVPSYRPFPLYLSGFFLDHALYFIAALVGFLLSYGSSNLQKIDFLEISFFYAGFYTLASVQAVLLNWGAYDFYLLFLLPLLRIVLVLLAALFFVNAVYSYGWIRAGYLLGFATLPIATAFVTYLHETHRSTLSMIVTIAFLSISFAIRYIVKE
jgi:hypothetical protein